MIRKQIYLTPEIDRELEILARSKGKSVAETIREILYRSLKVRENNEAPADFLLKLATQAKKGPKDLSSNFNSYLYGSRSPNYGRR